MPDYDFHQLSPIDFEKLVRDVLQEKWSVMLETFPAGRDRGIDLRLMSGTETAIVVQCKHYLRSGVDALKRDLKKEASKVKKLRPERYVVATSVQLSVGDKEDIVESLSPFLQSTSDVLGQDDLNNLLGMYPDVEKRHYKLWISSAGVLENVVQASSTVLSTITEEEIASKVALFVPNPSLERAEELLEDLHYCVIAGAPGIGKTTLAEFLAYRYADQGYKVRVVSEDVSEGLAQLKRDEKQLFLYDDFLGKIALSASVNKNEDARLVKFVSAIRSSARSRLVMTTREYILTQAIQSSDELQWSTFHKDQCIIDLSDYTARRRAEILYNHLYFRQVPSDCIEDLLERKKYWKVVRHRHFNPRVIEWVTNPDVIGAEGCEGFSDRLVGALQDPTKIWENAFTHHLGVEARYVLFALASFPGPVPEETLHRVYDRLVGEAGVVGAANGALVSYRSALKQLEGTFVRSEKVRDSLFVFFSNPSVMEYVKSVLAESPAVLDMLVRELVDCRQFQGIYDLAKSTAKSIGAEDVLAWIWRSQPVIWGSIKRLWGTETATVLGLSATGTISRVPDTLSSEQKLRLFCEAASLTPSEEASSALAEVVRLYTAKVAQGDYSHSQVGGVLSAFAGQEIIPMECEVELANAVKDSVAAAPDVDLEHLYALSDATLRVPELFGDVDLTVYRPRFEQLLQYEVEDGTESPPFVLEGTIEVGARISEAMGDAGTRALDDLRDMLARAEAREEQDEDEQYESYRESMREQGDEATYVDGLFATLRG